MADPTPPTPPTLYQPRATTLLIKGAGDNDSKTLTVSEVERDILYFIVSKRGAKKSPVSMLLWLLKSKLETYLPELAAICPETLTLNEDASALQFSFNKLSQNGAMTSNPLSSVSSRVWSISKFKTQILENESFKTQMNSAVIDLAKDIVELVRINESLLISIVKPINEKYFGKIGRKAAKSQSDLNEKLIASKAYGRITERLNKMASNAEAVSWYDPPKKDEKEKKKKDKKPKEEYEIKSAGDIGARLLFELKREDFNHILSPRPHVLAKLYAMHLFTSLIVSAHLRQLVLAEDDLCRQPGWVNDEGITQRKEANMNNMIGTILFSQKCLIFIRSCLLPLSDSFYSKFAALKPTTAPPPVDVTNLSDEEKATVTTNANEVAALATDEGVEYSKDSTYALELESAFFKHVFEENAWCTMAVRTYMGVYRFGPGAETPTISIQRAGPDARLPDLMAYAKAFELIATSQVEVARKLWDTCHKKPE